MDSRIPQLHRPTETASKVPCGVFAVMALSGCSLREATAALADTKGIRMADVAGTTSADLVEAMRRLGNVHLDQWLTFNAGNTVGLKELPYDFLSPSRYLIGLLRPNHWVTVRFDEDWETTTVACSQEPYGVALANYKHRDAKVVTVLRCARANA